MGTSIIFLFYWMQAPSSTWTSFLSGKNAPKEKYRVRPGVCFVDFPISPAMDRL
jgi:hypothetical protein